MALRQIVRQVDRLQRLAVFEAAGRLGSFTAAGTELGMTQPAVTRHIRSLEHSIGVELFRRASNRSELTHAGRRLLEGIESGFSSIEHVIDEITDTPTVFVLAMPPGFSQQVIVPHLDSLQDALTGSDLRLWLFDRESELTGGTYDAAVRVGTGTWRGSDSRELFPEHVAPVATPQLATEWGLSPTSTPDEVLAAPLLHMDSADRPWMSWTEWFAALGLRVPSPAGRLTFNNYPSVLQQAVAGRGVALGWLGLVDDLLTDGILTVVGPEVASDRSYFLTWPKNRSTPALESLVNWLDDAIG